jgi:hypothetical protein
MLQIESKSLAFTINAPSLFAREDFTAWLNAKSRKFTWHESGEPDEWSDVIVMLEPSLDGEGTNSDMPGWDEVVAAVRAGVDPGASENHILVRLTNLAE